MPFIPIPNTMKVSLEYTLNGQLVVNVYHVEWPEPIITANLTAIAAVFANWWSVNMRQNFVTSMVLDRIVATDMGEAEGVQISYVTGLPQGGNIAGAPMPNNVAVVTSLRSSFSGRSRRGRKYWAGLVNTEVTDNFIGSALAAAIVADMVSLESAIDAAGGNLVVASLFSEGAPRTTGVVTTVQTFTTDLRIDTQRRRLPGTGE